MDKKLEQLINEVGNSWRECGAYKGGRINDYGLLLEEVKKARKALLAHIESNYIKKDEPINLQSARRTLERGLADIMDQGLLTYSTMDDRLIEITLCMEKALDELTRGENRK